MASVDHAVLTQPQSYQNIAPEGFDNRQPLAAAGRLNLWRDVHIRTKAGAKEMARICRSGAKHVRRTWISAPGTGPADGTI